MARKVGLTTVDNPFNPIDDFDHWWNFDIEHGYTTCELLDRVSFESDLVSPDQNDFERERAIDAIVEMHPTLYKKVVKENQNL